MIKIIQGELYRVRKSRLLIVCLLLSTFFVFALTLTFQYDTVKIPARSGEAVVASLNKFTEFLFTDYSLLLPLTLFLGCYFTEDYSKGTCAILFSKGTERRAYFFGKLIVSWITTLLYLVFNFLMAYLFLLSMLAGQQNIDCSIASIGGYLAIQMACFLGYAAFLCLLSCLFRFRALVFAIDILLLGALYLYLTKISAALDLAYSLYQYWIVGLSHKLQIDSYMHQLPVIFVTLLLYNMLPAALSFLIYQKADLRKQERR